jgi:hypothetical protein
MVFMDWDWLFIGLDQDGFHWFGSADFSSDCSVFIGSDKLVFIGSDQVPTYISTSCETNCNQNRVFF